MNMEPQADRLGEEDKGIGTMTFFLSLIIPLVFLFNGNLRQQGAPSNQGRLTVAVISCFFKAEITRK